VIYQKLHRFSVHVECSDIIVASCMRHLPVLGKHSPSHPEALGYPFLLNSLFHKLDCTLFVTLSYDQPSRDCFVSVHLRLTSFNEHVFSSVEFMSAAVSKLKPQTITFFSQPCGTDHRGIVWSGLVLVDKFGMFFRQLNSCRRQFPKTDN
jgi:hypothetical protein